ncbi:ATP-binding protein [Thioflexithrix psekupsensis]|uniref:histidine kinase n=1 Tax=Thioflexithrix psekupsensis TaxID=1570016 RepID=A0A251X7J4_9GAMM|nr:ATP-binding protein [Thioflexithrix psekupsensis]OUD13966.1 hypothetical protein TPSD3_06375 [Thioflexithrix psekupsensis]
MKKIIRRKTNPSETDPIPSHGELLAVNSSVPSMSWRILVVDDEPDIHAITRLSLAGFEFAGRKLEILQALSGQAAREILTQYDDIVVAIIDVVMETDDAGLRLVDFIRNERRDKLMRLIIRTGQPGLAPEHEVIERYDIDDYKEKNELTERKLYTTLRLALKSHQALRSLNTHKVALTKILDAAPELYHPQSVKQFFSGVLSQIISLCHLGENSLISTIKSGFVATAQGEEEIVIHAGTGYFADANSGSEAQAIKQACIEFLRTHQDNPESILSGDPLPKQAMLLRLKFDRQNKSETQSFIYLENTACLLQNDTELIKIMAYQCASALSNLQLYLDLQEAHYRTSQLLDMEQQARNVAESANSAKTIFLAKMSHELRTPLNAIIGYANLIEEEAEDFGHQDLLPDLKNIQNAGQQLLNMIADILDITKIESEQLQLQLHQFKLQDLLGEIETLMQPLLARRENQFKVICLQKNARVCSDKVKLKQVLLNLLHNANKFTQQGQITLEIIQAFVPHVNRKQCKSEQQTCQKCDTSGLMTFKVSDTGIGIPEPELERIFEAFIQVDSRSATTDGTTPGAGLGLSISRRLSQVMGGHISVQSELGKGSIFTLEVPINLQQKPT